METRSKTRAAQGQVPSEAVLKGPGPRPPTELEDLGWAALMGDGEAPNVGESPPEVGATAGPLWAVPAAAERAPDREPDVDYGMSTTSVPMASATTLRLGFLQ